MKTYHLTSSLPCQASIAAALRSAGTSPVICLGLDMELHLAAGAVIIGGGNAIDLGKHPREVWIALARWFASQGHTLHVVQEACGFGWEFHRQLLAAGAQSVVSAPEVLNGKRKTDKRDARALAALLYDRAARGNQRALRVVRPPTLEAQRRRSEGRHRQQLITLRNRLSAFGRGLLWDHDWFEVPAGWHGKRKWPRLKAALMAAGKDWLISLLEPMQAQLLSLDARIHELDEIIASHAAAMKLTAHAPKGLGAPTRLRLAVEMQDWNRLNNRKQVGSYAGFCPSEQSSGGRQRLGAIDRMGNARVRHLSVEAVWRLKQWNSGWRGFARFPHVFGPGAKVGPALKKKAVVACARLLLIDLWRIETGRVQLADVGLLPA